MDALLFPLPLIWRLRETKTPGESLPLREFVLLCETMPSSLMFGILSIPHPHGERKPFFTASHWA